MKFYFRDELLQELAILNEQSQARSRMAVLLGRRRIGKTSLALQFVKDKPFLYLFTAKKSERLLCESFMHEIKEKLNIVIHGRVESLKEIFAILFEYGKTHSFTLIVDEFQEFFYINPSLYSDLQALWDLHKDQTKILTIFIGSIYSLMHKIFENEKEPLFGRADRLMQVRPFTIPQIKIILQDYNIHSLESLFIFYAITGGVPKYLDALLTNGCKDLTSIIEFIIKENSPMLNEGRNQLIEEFGKDYITYFSILELIARGKTNSSEIHSVIQKNVSAYLDKLASTYNIIQSVRPIDAKPNAKLVKYQIIDNFLQFWFRFIHRNRDAIEIRNFEFVKEIIKRDFTTYSGRLLERMFVELLIETKRFNRIGSYWRQSGQDEIDIVAINDLEKIILLAEVKRQERRNSQIRLEQRAAHFYKIIQIIRWNIKD